MSRYKIPAIQEFANQQIQTAPLEDRLKQMERAEELLGELAPEKAYFYRDLHRRVTSGRQNSYGDLMIQGKDALHDFRVFVEDLSESADLSAENMNEPVLSVQDVSRRYNVSTKTVDRWRNRGLASRIFRYQHRKGIGFLQSSVERFVSQHAGQVQRGTRFSQISIQEREEIISESRRLTQIGKSLSEVSRILAEQFRRSPESIRYTIKNYNQDNPQAAIFPSMESTLTSDGKENMFRQFCRGISVDQLSKQFHCSKSAVERIITETRVKRLCEQPINFMYNDSFEDPSAEAEIFGPEPEPPKKQKLYRPPAGLPPYLASLYEVPLLSREQEAYHFRKMNFLKFRASRLRDQLDKTKVKKRELSRIESLLDEANQVKNLLIRRNLRLVVSVVKKYARPGSNFFELVSDGNESLMRAIEKFDYSRGFKLSTYATWAITRNFSRSIPTENKQLSRFRTGSDELFLGFKEEKSSQFEQEHTNLQQRQALTTILKRLNNRDQEIIQSRFGLKQGTEPQTLEQIGRVQGVSKERIRQLEARALKKLRDIVEEEKMDIPGI